MTKYQIMFVLFIMFMTGCHNMKNSSQAEKQSVIESFVFRHVDIPEGSIPLRAAYFSKVLRDYIPDRDVKCCLDLSLPKILTRCADESSGFVEKIKRNVEETLLSNLVQTNSFADGVSWGMINPKLQSLSCDYVDGKTLILILFASIPWKIDCQNNHIIVKVFPEELDVVEYIQKRSSGTHHFHKIQDFVLYEHFDAQLFFTHPDHPERIFVVAPPSVHKQAFSRLKEWQSSGLNTAILPDVSCLP